MDPEIKKEFEDLTQMIAEGFQDIEERMATKEDLVKVNTRLDSVESRIVTVESKMATKDDLKVLENKMEEGFSSLRSELRFEVKKIDERLRSVEEKLDRLLKTESEDVGAVYKDVEEIKGRLVLVEQRLGMRGQPA